MGSIRETQQTAGAAREAGAPGLAPGPAQLTIPELVRSLQRGAGNQAVSRYVARRALLRSPTSERLEALWNPTAKGAWFDALRALTAAERQDVDVGPMIDRLVAGSAHTDDHWLSRRLFKFGPEPLWPTTAGPGADALFDDRHRLSQGWGRERGGIGAEIEHSELGKPIEAFFFPGITNERALVIAGVHGTEVQGREVARRLMEDLQNSPTAPHFTVIVVPNLFPDSAARNRRETAINQGTDQQRTIHSNRNFPDFPAAGARTDAVGNPVDASGTAIDAVGNPIVRENLALIGLMKHFRPSRVISIHGTQRAFRAGIFVDPVSTREPADRDLALRAAQATAAEVADADTQTAIGSRSQTYGGDSLKEDIQERMDRGELAGRRRARLSAAERARFAHTAVVAGNQLYLGAGNENTGWSGELDQGISLGGYGPPRGMTVFTVEPAVNRSLGQYGDRVRAGDRLTHDQREVELQAYATAIRTVLLAPHPAPAAPTSGAAGGAGSHPAPGPGPAAPEPARAPEPALARKAVRVLARSPELVRRLREDLASEARTGRMFETLRRLRDDQRGEADVRSLIQDSLDGDDEWLGLNLYRHGRESRWPPRLQLERELKGWPETGDRDDVLRLLRALRGEHAGDAALIEGLRRTFAADPQTLEQALWVLEHGSAQTMTDGDADAWLTTQGIAHTPAGSNEDGTPVYTVGFNAAGTGVTLRYGLMEPSIPPPERRGTAAGEHAVTARTAAGIVRFMRWLAGQHRRPDAQAGPL